MRALVKNIKGFNLIELLVVIAIIGIISAVGYPNFTAWSKEREVRLAVEKINSLIKNTHAQTEKGTFAYVQIKFTNNADSLTVEGKGMTMSSLANKINDINDIWNRDASSRCDVQSTTYWDTDTAADTDNIKNFVYTIELDKVTSNLTIGGSAGGDGDTGFDTVGSTVASAICFSRNGKFYEAAEEFVGPGNAPFGFVYICRRISSGHTCPVSYGSGLNTKESPSGKFEHLNAVQWSRYGNFSTSKWSGNSWFEQ